MDLYFSEEEMKAFLEKNGYSFDFIKTWKSHNTYHNQVENSYSDVVIAYKKFYEIPNEIDGTYNDMYTENYKLRNVFLKELKEKLLNL